MKQLKSNVQLYTAALDQRPITIFQGKKLVGYGVITDITERAVKLQAEWYLREACEFYYE